MFHGLFDTPKEKALLFELVRYIEADILCTGMQVLSDHDLF